MKKYLILAMCFSFVIVIACNEKSSKKDKTQAVSQAVLEQTKSKSNGSIIQNENWIGIEEIVGMADRIAYKDDKSFNGKKYKQIIYLASFPNGNVCALNKDHSVVSLTSNGKELTRFFPDLKGEISSLAIDENNLIHIFSNQEKEVTNKVRGRKVVRKISSGVICTVFDVNGKQLQQIKLDTLKSATGARVVGDKFVVSDAASKCVAIFMKETGKSVAIMDGMRQCGGVLDVSVSPNNEVLVSNLGSFRVELFDLDGQRLGSFGKRGKELHNFHGCCNPVRLTNLTTGAVVSVEKFPTRIKIYSKGGVQKLPVAKELEGCKYMPFTSDKDNNLYVGASEKGLVKYISSK